MRHHLATQIIIADANANCKGFFEKSLDFIKKKYDQVALLRNERHFKIFDFEEGRAFEPDFLLILKKNNSQKNTILQVFIEPKGDLFKDVNGRFEQSAEGWKQKFLLKLEKESKLDLRLENKDFRLLGLPFYNESLKHVFEEAFEEKL